MHAVGLLSPGDMGHSIGAVLVQHGLRVVTCLAGRSQRTRGLAARAGIGDVPSLEDLVRQVNLVICVLVPARALETAQAVAAAMHATGARPLYADCNAIAPRTVREAARIIQAAGARFVDVGIVGPPPRRPGTRFYTSGPGAAEFAELANYGLGVHVIGDEVGQASGIKMCYGALTKGVQALGVELLVAARAMGLDAALEAEQESSMPEVLGFLKRSVPIMPPKAYRWVGEMEEIAKCFSDLGMTPRILEGAADMYRFVADTPIGHETPENRDQSRDLRGVVAALADALPTPAAAAE